MECSAGIDWRYRNSKRTGHWPRVLGYLLSAMVKSRNVKMSRRTLSALVAALSIAAALPLVSCHDDRTHPKVDDSRYVLAPGEKERLQAKATGGDCAAATQLAKYYLYGALDLDTATQRLRVAAKCPDIAPKESLIRILIHDEDNPAVAREISHLIQEIRDIDPTRASTLEFELQHTKSAP